jgi:DNA-binding winged helix-turn-helix (wHTH) protein
VARCFDGAAVGEDAVTRAVGEVRRLSRQAPGSFELQTIAEVGYRLTPAVGAARARPVPARAFEPRSPAIRLGRLVALAIAAGIAYVASRLLL